MKTMQRIVRETQGAWRYQTPYRVKTYRLAANPRGELKWVICHESSKLTFKKIVTAWGLLPRGGIGNTLSGCRLENEESSPYNQDL